MTNLIDKAHYELGSFNGSDADVIYFAWEDAMDLWFGEATVKNICSLISQYGDVPEDFIPEKKPSAKLLKAAEDFLRSK